MSGEQKVHGQLKLVHIASLNKKKHQYYMIEMFYNQQNPILNLVMSKASYHSVLSAFIIKFILIFKLETITHMLR